MKRKSQHIALRLLILAIATLLVLGGCDLLFGVWAADTPPPDIADTPPPDIADTPPPDIEAKIKIGVPYKDTTDLRGAAERQEQGGNYRRFLQVDGRERFYDVHLPDGYDPAVSYPAVLVFHGGGGNPVAIRWQSRMDEVADTNDFIAVYPAGTGFFGTYWLTFNAIGCCGYAHNYNVDDISFVRHLLDDLEQLFPINTNRVYASGYSNGSQLTYLIGAALSARIAAIAPVAAPMTRHNYEPARPISVMHFHGALDRNVPLEGGQGDDEVTFTDFFHMSIDDNITYWVNHNNAPAEPEREWTVGTTTCTLYGPGDDKTEVVLCVAGDGGHTWPGGRYATQEEAGIVGPISDDIFASELMWEFFASHPLNSTQLFSK